MTGHLNLLCIALYLMVNHFKRKNSMKLQKRNLTLPTIRKFREAIESGKLGAWLIESGEETHAGSVKVKYTLKNRRWVVTVEAKRIYDNKH